MNNVPIEKENVKTVKDKVVDSPAVGYVDLSNEIAHVQVKERYDEAENNIYDVFTISYKPRAIMDVQWYKSRFTFEHWKQFEILRPYSIFELLKYLHKIIKAIESDLSTLAKYGKQKR